MEVASSKLSNPHGEHRIFSLAQPGKPLRYLKHATNIDDFAISDLLSSSTSRLMMLGGCFRYSFFARACP